MTYHYQRILQGFKEWLELLNYAESSVQSLCNQTKALLGYLENENTDHITKLKPEHLERFYHIQQCRISKSTGTLLSNSTLNGYINNFHLLSRYLRETQQAFVEVDIPLEERQTPEKEALCINEIKLLYKATSEDWKGLGQRAILGIYYGCGLRSNEGLQLNISDVLLEQRMLYVRKGKFSKERYVPFTERIYKDLTNYLKHCRPQLLKVPSPSERAEGEAEEEQAFLIGNTGKRMCYNTLLKQLKTIQGNSTDEALKSKRIGLHHLRHSIATHLLQKGMDLEDIAYFLGHASLSSTQVYTHIAAIMNDK
jgi:integrase/recombinase XerD